MKKYVAILLCAMMTLLCCGFASASQGDFLLIDGFTWDTPVENYPAIFSADPKAGSEDGVNLNTLSFSGVSVPGLDNEASFEFALAGNPPRPVTAMMLVTVDKPLVSLNGEDAMKQVYDMLVAEGEQLYANRSEVLFSSTAELAAMLENPYGYTPIVSGILNGLNSLVTTFQSMYNTNSLDCITNTKTWLVDDSFGVTIMYSGQNVRDNEIVVMYMNAETLVQNFDSIFASADATADVANGNYRFGLPEGCTWETGKQAFISALGDSYLSEEDGTVCALFVNDPFVGGYKTFGEFSFAGDQLVVGVHTVFTADTTVYKDVVAILKDDLGAPLGEAFKESAMGAALQYSTTIEDVEVWLTGGVEVLCALDPAEEMIYVMSVSVDAVM